MTEFKNMWRNYVNFSDRTTVRGYWMAFLVNLIVSFIIGFIFGIISAASGSTGILFVSYIYALAVFIPGLAMMVRRLRDAGKHWACIFLSLIPLVGIIILIIFLVKPSIPDNGVPQV